MLNSTKLEAIGKKREKFFPASTSKSQKNSIYSVFKDKKPRYYENRFVLPNGRKWMGTWLAPIEDKEGQVIYIMGIARDISNQKESEEQLKKVKEHFQLLFERMPVLAYSVGLDGKIIDINKLTVKTLGYKDKNELLGKPFLTTIYAPSSREKAKRLFSKWKKTGIIKNEEMQIISKDGEIKDVILNVDSFYDDEGHPFYSISTQIDITKRKQSEEEIRLKSILLDNAGDSVFMVDMNGKILYLNETAYKTRGYTKKELLEKNITKLGSEKDAKHAKKRLKKLKKEGKIQFEATHLRKDGSIINVEVNAQLIEHKGEKVAVSINRDRTESIKTESALRESEELYRSFVETSPDAVTLTDLEGKIIKVSKQTLKIHGYKKEKELIGKNSLELIEKKGHEKAIKNIEKVLKGSSIASVEYILIRKDGSIFPAELSASLIKDSKGNPKAFIGITRDITERKKIDDIVRHQAYYDSLTDLPNRVLFYDRLTTQINYAKRYKHKLAVLFLDLDYFKDINDEYGHIIGDKFLKKVADRLKRVLRESETCARLGGDEFLVLLPHISSENDAEAAAKRIIKSFSQPWEENNIRAHIATSIGISIYPDDGESAEELTFKADSAMYLAKLRGGRKYLIHNGLRDDEKLNIRIRERKILNR